MSGCRGGGASRLKARVFLRYRMLASIQHAFYSVYKVLFTQPFFSKPLTQPLLSSEPPKAPYNLRKRKPVEKSS